MKRIALVGCAKTKIQTRNPSLDWHPARDIYDSDLFRKRVAHVEGRNLEWFILSAKSGCIAPETPIKLYDQTMNEKCQVDKVAWVAGVVGQLCDRLYYDFKIDSFTGLTFEMHCGKHYCDVLGKALVLFGAKVNYPVKGLGIGQQLAYYAGNVSSAAEVK